LDIKSKLSKQIHQLKGVSKVLVHAASEEDNGFCKVAIVHARGVKDLSVEISKSESDFCEVREACDENDIPVFYLDVTDRVSLVSL
jgi:hypothetical protein